MKPIIFISLFLISLLGFSQETENNLRVPQNVILFETGFWNRGLIGLGYNRNIASNSSNLFYSVHGSVGTGFGFTHPNLYVTAAPSINIGSDNVYFTLGAEGKYVSMRYFERSGYDIELYEGIMAGGFVGINGFSQGGFNFKARVSLMASANEAPQFVLDPTGSDRFLVLPGVSLSFGYRIGK